jgi:hypothetical protein
LLLLHSSRCRYTDYLGDEFNYINLKNVSLYTANASTNVQAWLAVACSTALPYICEIPLVKFVCP